MNESQNMKEKTPVNSLTLENIEALIGEEMDEMSLYDCTVNWSCNQNS